MGAQVLSGSIRDARGYTLVEMALVLVIMAVLVGGVMSTRGLVNNAKGTQLMRQVQELNAAIMSYSIKMGALPGDTVGSDGAIDDSPGAFTALADEDFILSVGTGELANAFEGIVHIIGNADITSLSGTGGTLTAPAALTGTNYIIFTKIPAKFAGMIDSKLDNGTNNTGRIQSYNDGGTTAIDYTSTTLGNLYVQYN